LVGWFAVEKDLTMDNKALYRRYIERCNSHDFGTLGEFVATDVRVNGEPYGLDRYQAEVASIVDTFPDYHWEIELLIGEGEYLAARLTDTGTHRGVYAGVEPTNRSITTMELAFYRLREGMIVEVWAKADDWGTLSQLTTVPNLFGT
jgi:predicted ester cyclase